MTSDTETHSFETDAEGYLVDPNQWSEPIARELARREGIALGEDHWRVIRFMRDYYAAHQIAADARFAIKHLAETHGAAARRLLFELFPYGYVKQACKIAGMRRPRAWSTG
jgi:tRNA 2-thiouridine synthesizing protein E